jgi:hypothetical protein
VTFTSKLKALKKQGKDKYLWGGRKFSKCSSNERVEFNLYGIEAGITS